MKLQLLICAVFGLGACGSDRPADTPPVDAAETSGNPMDPASEESSESGDPGDDTDGDGETSDGSGSTTDPVDPTDDTGRPTAFCEHDDVWAPAFEDQPVPPNEDTYVCRGFTLDAGALKHMTAFRANIDNAAYVHHMILYRVTTPFPSEPSGCFHGPDWVFQYGWAPGVEEFTLPEEAGFLVGDGAGGQTHFVLEVHYNNPLQTPGEVDSTGVDVCVTDTLRPNNASMLALGKVPGIAIPPGEPAWEETGVCPSNITQAALSGPLTVFGSFLHAHLLARQIYTEQFRDGALIGDLGRDDVYDFNDQHIQMIEGEIQPGDELRTTCIYDSTGETDTTYGGEGHGRRDVPQLPRLLSSPARPRLHHRAVSAASAAAVVATSSGSSAGGAMPPRVSRRTFATSSSTDDTA